MILTVPDELQQRLRDHRQEHVLAGWPNLNQTEQHGLIEQLSGLNLGLLQRLYDSRDEWSALPSFEYLAPIPSVRLEATNRPLKSAGEAALRRGEVAVLLVAGGQGTRLGFDQPKGMFPIGPVTNKTLFQIHAEKVLALSRRYGREIRLLVMTSPATDADTRDYFAAHNHLSLAKTQVTFFCQGTMPALDLATGKLLLEAPGRLCLSPNGHGGTLQALADCGLLDELEQSGVRDVFYFQVDNPLVKIADPLFLGHHRAAEAEVSSKGVLKLGPTEKMGNLVLQKGRCALIEYSDMPHELAQQTDKDGRLRFRLGSPAIHLFDVDFLKRVTSGPSSMPYHLARKKVEHIDDRGMRVEPVKENALKFELFIFDVLPHAERWTVVETDRAEEFEPLKNETGPNSPHTVRQAISNLAARWLTEAGFDVPRDTKGNAAVPLEISPLLACDAEELGAKAPRDMRFDRATYLGDNA